MSSDKDHPRNQTVIEGKSGAEFYCNLTAIPGANVTWKKLEEPNKQFLNGTTLTLRNITRDDAGS